MFRLLRYWHLSFASVKNSLKLQTSISPQRKMVETLFKNWYAQLIMTNLNFSSLNNFASARGAYYGEYGIWDYIHLHVDEDFH